MLRNLPEFAEDCDLNGFIGHILTDDLKKQMTMLAQVYAKHHPTSQQPARTIPRIIHQIWIGPKEIPDEYKEYIEGWKRLNPGFEHRLWRDDDVARLKLKTQPIIDQLPCVGQKTDLIRAEILAQMGGLYVDCDYECIEPIGEIHDRYDFYGTLRSIPLMYIVNPVSYPAPILVCNSLIGSIPRHPILMTYLDLVLSESSKTFPLVWREKYSTARLFKTEAQLQRIKETLLRTYIPFHNVVVAGIANQENVNILFPPTVFNPRDTTLSYQGYVPAYWLKRLGYSIEKRSFSVKKYKGPLSHTVADHHSKATWLDMV